MKNILWKSGSLRMGGLEKILIEVLKSMDLNKFNITLIIDDDCGKENIFEKEIPNGIKYYFLKPEKLNKFTDKCRKRKSNFFFKILYNNLLLIEKIFSLYKLKKLTKTLGKIDVLIDYDAGAAKYIKYLKGIERKIVWIHNSIPNLKKKKSKIQRFGKRLKNYDNIVVICDDMMDEIKKIYPCLEKKIKRIYNSFNFDEIIFKAKDSSVLTEKESNLIKEDYFLAVSRLDTVQKDYETLLKSFSNLENNHYKLYIVGDGPDRKKIEEMIKQYNLEEKVYLLGKKQNPYIWMKNCQAFVHSSKYEGFGLVILEALILGKTVISSNCKVGPSEILLNGKYGELFSVGNSEELTQKMEKIMNDTLLREKYERLSKEAIERFNMKRTIKDIEELLLNNEE